MNGTTAALCVKMIKRPRSKKIKIIGAIHQSLFCHKKAKNSLTVASLELSFLNQFLIFIVSPNAILILNHSWSYREEQTSVFPSWSYWGEQVYSIPPSLR